LGGGKRKVQGKGKEGKRKHGRAALIRFFLGGERGKRGGGFQGENGGPSPQRKNIARIGGRKGKGGKEGREIVRRCVLNVLANDRGGGVKGERKGQKKGGGGGGEGKGCPQFLQRKTRGSRKERKKGKKGGTKRGGRKGEKEEAP